MPNPAADLEFETRPVEAGSFSRQAAFTIVFTTVDDGLTLLQHAYRLAAHRKICLLVAQPPNYPAQLISPSMLASFMIRYFRAFVARRPIRISTLICLVTRSELGGYLAPNSIVLIAGQKRWWRSEERRLANKLSGLGHEVRIVSANHIETVRSDQLHAKSDNHI